MSILFSWKNLIPILSFLLFFNLINCEIDRNLDDEEFDDDEPVYYKIPRPAKDQLFLYESFDDTKTFDRRWIRSSSSVNGVTYSGQWDLVQTDPKLKGDLGLRLLSKSAHHAISTKLERQYEFKGENFVLQYDVRFRDGQDCGGAYLKLLRAPSPNLTEVNNHTAYSLMFGPDKCGNDHQMHFIFTHRNKLTGENREVHWTRATQVKQLVDVISDRKWHLMRLVVRPDNTFEISIDFRVVGKGDLYTDFSPSVKHPKEIDDPDDVKPAEWDDREKIPDTGSLKPSNWDENEPRKIPDPDARKPEDWLGNQPVLIDDSEDVKPDDWSEDIDGTWEPRKISNPNCEHVSGCGKWRAPLIDNPQYRGKWKPAMINNPAFKGKWQPRKISNPYYYEDLHPYQMLSIDAVSFEVWSLSENILFDNILITSSVDLANNIADNSYQVKRDLNDYETDNWLLSAIKRTNRRPSLWFLDMLVVTVPLVIFLNFCCFSPMEGDYCGEKKQLSQFSSRKFKPPTTEAELYRDLVNEACGRCYQARNVDGKWVSVYPTEDIPHVQNIAAQLIEEEEEDDDRMDEKIKQDDELDVAEVDKIGTESKNDSSIGEGESEEDRNQSERESEEADRFCENYDEICEEIDQFCAKHEELEMKGSNDEQESRQIMNEQADLPQEEDDDEIDEGFNVDEGDVGDDQEAENEVKIEVEQVEHFQIDEIFDADFDAEISEGPIADECNNIETRVMTEGLVNEIFNASFDRVTHVEMESFIENAYGHVDDTIVDEEPETREIEVKSYDHIINDDSCQSETSERKRERNRAKRLKAKQRKRRSKLI